MTVKEKELLGGAGFELEETIQRFLGNEALYVKFLLKFPQDQNFGNWQKAIKEEDYENALRYAHTLKGLAGNLGFQALYQQLLIYVEDLRSENRGAAEEREGEIKAAYGKVIEAISTIGG